MIHSLAVNQSLSLFKSKIPLHLVYRRSFSIVVWNCIQDFYNCVFDRLWPCVIYLFHLFSYVRGPHCNYCLLWPGDFEAVFSKPLFTVTALFRKTKKQKNIQAHFHQSKSHISFNSFLPNIFLLCPFSYVKLNKLAFVYIFRCMLFKNGVWFDDWYIELLLFSGRFKKSALNGCSSSFW